MLLQIFPQSVSAKVFLKSVNIWRRRGQKFSGKFILTQGIVYYLHTVHTVRKYLNTIKLFLAISKTFKYQLKTGI